MDDRRFDRLARTLAAGDTRRAALRLLGGAALAAGLARLGLAADEAAADDRDASCRGSCDRCTGDGQCCSGRCREGACRCKPRGACKVDRACCSGRCRRDGTCKPAEATACGRGDPSDGEDCVPTDGNCTPGGTPQCCDGDECVGDTAEGGVCLPLCEGGTTRCGTECVDLQTDPNNCGGCGKQPCLSGGCKNGECCATGTCGSLTCPATADNCAVGGTTLSCGGGSVSCYCTNANGASKCGSITCQPCSNLGGTCPYGVDENGNPVSGTCISCPKCANGTTNPGTTCFRECTA